MTRTVSHNYPKSNIPGLNRKVNGKTKRKINENMKGNGFNQYETTKSKLRSFNNAHLSSERRHKEPRYVPVCGRVWACVCTGLRVTEIRQSHGIELSSVCYGSV